MINLKAMKDLFKPYELHFVGLQDLLDVTGLSFKEWLKIDVESECSKSFDESCMNYECQYNFIKIHGNELYCEVAKEIQDERRELEKRIEMDRKKYGYI